MTEKQSIELGDRVTEYTVRVTEYRVGDRVQSIQLDDRVTEYTVR